jgi:hypothetical protein
VCPGSYRAAGPGKENVRVPRTSSPHNIIISRAAAGLVAVGFSSAQATAQTTRLIMEASVDNAQTWSSYSEAQPGQVVYFRLRAQWMGGIATGLSGFTCQPTLSRWNASGDEVLAFTFPGIANDGTPTTETAYDGRNVSSLPATNTGRLFPFGSAGQGITSSSGLLTHHVDPDGGGGQTLRFAGSGAVTPTTSLSWGVKIAQQPQALMGTHYNSSLNVEVFRYAVRFGETEGITRTATVAHLSGGIVRWYGVPLDFPDQFPPEFIVATVVPGPGGLVGLAAGGVLVMRRRRS